MPIAPPAPSTTASRQLSLAAGTVLDATPSAAVLAAARAGFDAVGLRWSLDGGADPAVVRTLLDDVGIGLLDLEVVRLGPGSRLDASRALVDVAAALGARFLLTVSQHEDDARTVEELAQLAGWCAPAGVTVALETMRFTGVPTLAAGAALARQVPGVELLVDALHLHRGGEGPADLGALPVPVGYLQLCDAPLVEPPGSVPALALEARHDRLFPGEGELPLVEIVRALPADLPCSIEVQNDRWTAVPVIDRARHAHTAARRLLARA
jgi:sugar phosphate isomerase/epimerase